LKLYHLATLIWKAYVYSFIRWVKLIWLRNFDDVNNSFKPFKLGTYFHKCKVHQCTFM
jgi:hypothetical protein